MTITAIVLEGGEEISEAEEDYTLLRVESWDAPGILAALESQLSLSPTDEAAGTDQWNRPLTVADTLAVRPFAATLQRNGNGEIYVIIPLKEK